MSFVRSTLLDHFDQLIESKRISDTIRVLNYAFAEHKISFWKSETKTKYTWFHPRGQIAAGIESACVDPDNTIEIFLLDHVQDAVTDDIALQNTFSNALSAIVRHELVHRVQNEKSGGKYLDQIDYLDDDDDCDWRLYFTTSHEIKAFSYEIIQQLLNCKITPDRIAWMLANRNPQLYSFSARYDQFRTAIRGIQYEHQYLNRLHKNMFQVLTS